MLFLTRFARLLQAHNCDVNIITFAVKQFLRKYNAENACHGNFESEYLTKNFNLQVSCTFYQNQLMNIKEDDGIEYA